MRTARVHRGRPAARDVRDCMQALANAAVRAGPAPSLVAALNAPVRAAPRWRELSLRKTSTPLDLLVVSRPQFYGSTVTTASLISAIRFADLE
jgi:hypothetical protein